MRIFLTFTLTTSLLAAVSLTAGAEEHVIIGTGSVTGVYYPTGGAICRLVNRDTPGMGVRCSVESTGGSLDNLRGIRAGRLDLGVVQSDWQYHAYQGTGRFAEEGPFNELRSLFSVHNEPFTVVARKDAGIERFDDLKGKRVNIGNPGSGQRGTMEVLMDAYGWTQDTFAEVAELRPADQSEALCDNQIDAIVYTVGHPSGAIQEATTACATTLVSVSGPVVDQLVANNDYYSKAVIRGGQYPSNAGDIETFGVSATVVASTALPNDVVYQMVKSVFEGFDTLTRLHPAFQNLDKKTMISDGLSAPLHGGAVRYYQEAGLLPDR